MNTIANLLVFRNLNVACFDKDGEQIGDLQKPLLVLWAENAVNNGYDPEGVIVEMNDSKWKLFKTTDGGWNLEAVV